MGPQWLLLSAITSVAIIVLFKELKRVQINIISIFIFLFLLNCLVSFIYSINIQESIITFLRLAVIFTSFTVFKVCISKINSTRPLIFFVLIFSFLESFFVFSHLIENYNFGDLLSRDREFAGLAANVNIGAFSTLYKLPVLFWVFISQKKFFKFFAATFISLSIFSIFLTGSRGAILSLIFLVLALVIYLIANKKWQNLAQYSVLIILPLIIFFKGYNPINDSNNIAQRITNFSDSSTSNRLSLYTNSIDFSLSNPFGSGLGTYKISSIASDIPNMKGYQVAYHNHNDFLQYATEIGIVGATLYLLIFLSVLYFVFKSLRNNFNPILFFLSISIIVFLGDSLINFPYSRPIQMIQIVYLLAFLLYLLGPEIPVIKKDFRLSRIVLLILILASLVSNYKVFDSFKDQLVMLSSFNANKFPQSDFKNLEDINYKYPNLTVTGLPIASLVSLYYMGTENYHKGLALNRENISINPYLGFTEHAQSRIFYKANQLDSTYHYAKIAFDKFPNNQAHSSTFQQVLERLNKFDELEEMFLKIKDNHVELEWSNYLKIISEKEDFDLVNVTYAQEALSLFPDSKDIYNYSNYIIYGKKNVFKSVELNNEANAKFKDKSFEEAISLWSQALTLTPYETAFHENITRSYIGLQDFKKAIEYMESLNKEVLNKNDNYLYFLGVCYLNTNELENACTNLRKSAKKGNKNSLALVNSYCN